MIFHLVTDRVNTAVYITFFTKICHARHLLFLCHTVNGINEVFHAFIFYRADRHDRYPQFHRHLFYIHRTAVSAHLVHHVERKHHRDMHLKKLQRQIEISLDIRRVHNVDDPIRLFI